MADPDRIYNWISNVITSCENMAHIKACEVLINYYEKMDPDKYIINALRVSLQLKIDMIQKKLEEARKLTIEEEVWNMFQSGMHTMSQISESLNVKFLKVQEIITKKMKESK